MQAEGIGEPSGSGYVTRTSKSWGTSIADGIAPPMIADVGLMVMVEPKGAVQSGVTPVVVSSFPHAGSKTVKMSKREAVRGI
jgi:hypothetical protein